MSISTTTPETTSAGFATLTRDELAAKIARSETFRLVMASSDWGFLAKHIPGSIHFHSPADMFAALTPSDTVIVYCTNADCHASLATLEKLRDRGFTHLLHYPGGLIDWESAGLPVEGDWQGR